MDLSFAHIVLNVTDLSRSKLFYEKFLRGFSVIDESDAHVGLSNGAFSAWLVGKNKENEVFTGKATDDSVGMHHFAFKVESMEELKSWEAYLLEESFELSTGGITDDDYGGQGIFLKDPDNVRLEIHLG